MQLFKEMFLVQLLTPAARVIGIWNFTLQYSFYFQLDGIESVKDNVQLELDVQTAV